MTNMAPFYAHQRQLAILKARAAAAQNTQYVDQAARGVIFFTPGGYWTQATLDAAKRGARIVIRQTDNPAIMRSIYLQTRARGPAAYATALKLAQNVIDDTGGMKIFNDFVRAGKRDTVTVADINHGIDVAEELARRAANRSFNITAVELTAAFAVAVAAPAIIAASPSISISSLSSEFSAATGAVKGAAVAAEGYAQTAKNVYGAYALTRAYKAGKSAQSQAAARAAAAIQQDNALKAALAQQAAARATLDKQPNIGTPSPPAWVKLAIVVAPLSLFFM